MKLKPFLRIFGAIAVVLTLFPFVAIDYWWIRMFDYPHIQLTILTFVAFMVYFFRFDIKSWKDYTFVTVLAACFIFQLSKIYPYTPLADYQVNDNEESLDDNIDFVVLVSNVLQKNRKSELLLKEIDLYKPEIIVLTETDVVWKKALSPALNTQYPYRVLVPKDNTYGMFVYSKYELLNPEVQYLIDDSIPSIRATVKLPKGNLVELYAIHPTPPMPQENPTSTDRDAEMMVIAKIVKDCEIPVIVTGDFNDVAWSQTTSLFQNVSGLLDPRVGRGFYNTFTTESWLLRWPLDHLFVSEDFRLIEIGVGNHIGSDHFPLYAKLSLQPHKALEQKAEKPTNREIKKADNAIEQENDEQKIEDEKEALKNQ